jgi:hypothetical protein
MPKVSLLPRSTVVGATDIIPVVVSGTTSYIEKNDLFPIFNIKNYGADTGEDITTAVTDARTAATTAGTLFIPRGTYTYSGTDYTVDGDFLFISKGFNALAVNPLVSAETNGLTVLVQTSTDTPIDATQSRVGISATCYAQGAQHGTGIRANCYNLSTDGNGNTAFYGHVQSGVIGSGGTFALHGEARHGGGSTHGLNIEMGSFDTAGAFYGAVINNTTASLNAAGQTNTLTGASPVAHATATGVLMTGSNNTNAMGGWVRGIHFHANSMRASGNTILIDANAVPDTHLRTAATAPTATADIWLGADSPIGLLLGGTYTTSAIRINAGERIGLEATNAVKFGWDSGSLSVQFLNSGTNRVSLTLSGTPAVNINGTKVIGVRDTGWTAMTGSPDKATAYATGTVTLAQLAGRVASLQAALTTHGIIGA